MLNCIDIAVVTKLTCGVDACGWAEMGGLRLLVYSSEYPWPDYALIHFIRYLFQVMR